MVILRHFVDDSYFDENGLEHGHWAHDPRHHKHPGRPHRSYTCGLCGKKFCCSAQQLLHYGPVHDEWMSFWNLTDADREEIKQRWFEQHKDNFISKQGDLITNANF